MLALCWARLYSELRNLKECFLVPCGMVVCAIAGQSVHVMCLEMKTAVWLQDQHCQNTSDSLCFTLIFLGHLVSRNLLQLPEFYLWSHSPQAKKLTMMRVHACNSSTQKIEKSEVLRMSLPLARSKPALVILYDNVSIINE